MNQLYNLNPGLVRKVIYPVIAGIMVLTGCATTGNQVNAIEKLKPLQMIYNKKTGETTLTEEIGNTGVYATGTSIRSDFARDKAGMNAMAIYNKFTQKQIGDADKNNNQVIDPEELIDLLRLIYTEEELKCGYSIRNGEFVPSK